MGYVSKTTTTVTRKAQVTITRQCKFCRSVILALDYAQANGIIESSGHARPDDGMRADQLALKNLEQSIINMKASMYNDVLSYAIVCPSCGRFTKEFAGRVESAGGAVNMIESAFWSVAIERIFGLAMAVLAVFGVSYLLLRWAVSDSAPGGSGYILIMVLILGSVGLYIIYEGFKKTIERELEDKPFRGLIKDQENAIAILRAAVLEAGNLWNRDIRQHIRSAVRLHGVRSKSQDGPVSEGHTERSSGVGSTDEDSSQLSVELVEIPAGSFLMESPHSEPSRGESEVQHEVVISRPFLMCTTPVTQKVWKKVMGNNPSGYLNADRPVDVSWFDAVQFCNKLSELEGLKPAYEIRGEDVTWNQGADGFRLPTEAEWEYACRAGTTTAYNIGDSKSDLDRAGWYRDNSGRNMHPVGLKEPNAWGLYDMHGNVYEWCWDWFGHYPSEKVTDPTGPSTGANRVIRGGGWSSLAPNCRSASRHNVNPVSKYVSVGLRPVRSAP